MKFINWERKGNFKLTNYFQTTIEHSNRYMFAENRKLGTHFQMPYYIRTIESCTRHWFRVLLTYQLKQKRNSDEHNGTVVIVRLVVLLCEDLGCCSPWGNVTGGHWVVESGQTDTPDRSLLLYKCTGYDYCIFLSWQYNDDWPTLTLFTCWRKEVLSSGSQWASIGLSRRLEMVALFSQELTRRSLLVQASRKNTVQLRRRLEYVKDNTLATNGVSISPIVV